MSIRITSGRSSRAASTACSPSSASPTISISSSTRGDHPEPGAHERLVVDDQHANGHAAPPATGSRAEILLARPWAGLELAAAEGDALAHADAVPAAVVRVLVRAVVRHFDLDILARVADGDPGMSRARVLERVRQCLLHDPVGGEGRRRPVASRACPRRSARPADPTGAPVHRAPAACRSPAEVPARAAPTRSA